MSASRWSVYRCTGGRTSLRGFLSGASSALAMLHPRVHSRSGGVVTVDVKAAARAPGAAQRGRTSLRPHLTGEYARVLCGACFLAWKSASNTSNLRVECFIFVSLPLKMVCYWSAIAHMSLYPVSVVDSNLSGRETGAHHSADGKQITRTSTTSTNVPARRNTPTLKAGSC